MIQSELNWN